MNEKTSWWLIKKVINSSSPAKHRVRVSCKEWRVYDESSMIHNQGYSIWKLAKEAVVACAAFINVVDGSRSIAGQVARSPRQSLALKGRLQTGVGWGGVAGLVGHVRTDAGMGTTAGDNSTTNTSTSTLRKRRFIELSTWATLNLHKSRKNRAVLTLSPLAIFTRKHSLQNTTLFSILMAHLLYINETGPSSLMLRKSDWAIQDWILQNLTNFHRMLEDLG